jgi:DNA-binding MarR family transcriptional regulator
MNTNGLERSPLHLLHRVKQCAADIFQADVAREELTPRRLAVLLSVAQNEGASQTDLVEATGIDRSTLPKMVALLQGKGLLHRRRTKEDVRAYAVTLTDEGRRVLRKAEPLAKRVDTTVLNALPAAQRDGFIAKLQAIIESLEGRPTLIGWRH